MAVIPLSTKRLAQLCCALLVLSISTISRAEIHQGDFVDQPSFIPTPKFAEEPLPAEKQSFVADTSLAGPIAPAASQPKGALYGRIVFMSCGHGWTYDPTYWRQQRGTTELVNEDNGNIDQMNFFAAYCFNAGATVVPCRPIGRQTNEVVLDNDSPGVTFAGTWNNSSATNYYWGSAGDVPYRYAALAASETATATYTPTISKEGFYPVYTWVRYGSDRGHQLYRIKHTGGEAQVRIPHHMVGNGWVYLGQYYFNAGSNAAIGSVVISNLRGSTNGSVVIADGIRFGNGMGSIVRGSSVSGYPREEECTRYWVQAGMGYGMPSSIWGNSGDDETDSWLAPPRLSREMNQEGVGRMAERVHISFHSNAGGGRGVVGLINTGAQTPNQAALAKLCGDQVNDEMVALGAPPLEVAWSDHATTTYSGGYSEISNNNLSDEMDATIIEVAYHDDPSDAKILRDPKGRNAIARAAYHAVVRYMNVYDTVSPVLQTYLPEPPQSPRAIANANGITITWSAPVAQAGSGTPTNYVVYYSTNGYGFGNGVSVGNVTTYTFTNLAANTDFYFQIAAANAGGESFPTEVVGCRRSSTNGAPKVLYVNAFDRFDRTLAPYQPTTALNYVAPGSTGTSQRVIPRMINSFDYVVQHGKAMQAYGMAFDSCQNEDIANGTIALTNYPIVIWAGGAESTANETFSATEQTKVTAFLAAGGHLFVSGSEIGWDLDRASGPTAADRTFFNNQLHADFGTDANDDSGIYTVSSIAGAIFAGNSNASFDDGNKGIYWVQTPDIILPNGTGTKAALYYNGTTNPAAIQYDGSAGGGRVVYMSFPFETITASSSRTAVMASILNFFQPAKILTNPASATVVQNSNATFSVTAGGITPIKYQWYFNNTKVTTGTNSVLTVPNAQGTNAGNYFVVVTNASGAATSSVVSLSVLLAPTITAQPLDQTVLAGTNVTFSVTATGAAPLSYQWLLDGTNIVGATTNLLVRTNVQSSDAGNYSVVVTNVAGSVTSSNALLTLQSPPTQFQSGEWLSGEGFRFVFTGPTAQTNELQVSDDLIVWTTLTNLVNESGSSQFIDTNVFQPQRFFRLKRLP